MFLEKNRLEDDTHHWLKTRIWPSTFFTCAQGHCNKLFASQPIYKYRQTYLTLCLLRPTFQASDILREHRGATNIGVFGVIFQKLLQWVRLLLHLLLVRFWHGHRDVLWGPRGFGGHRACGQGCRARRVLHHRARDGGQGLRPGNVSQRRVVEIHLRQRCWGRSYGLQMGEKMKIEE